MKFTSVALLIGLLFGIGTQAEAQQFISFDEMSPTANLILGDVTCVASGHGFRFQSDHFHLIGLPSNVQFQGFATNETPHLGYESGRGFPVVMQRIGGGTFALSSFDAAEFYTPPGFADRPNAELITVTGHQADGGTVSFSFNLDGVLDGSGGVADFEHVVLPATFVNLTSVVFTGLRLDGSDGGISFDNLEYQLSVTEALAPCVATPLPPETPVVSITNPTSGIVLGTVTVEATATDNLGVSGVQFRIDGALLGAEDTVAPYSVSWDSTTVVDGTHTITADARDAVGNIGTASVVVTVQNIPPAPVTPHTVEFDGINDYASMPDAPSLSFGTGTADSPLTMEMWLRPDAISSRYQILGKWSWNNALNQEYRLFIAANTLRLELRDQSAGVTAYAYIGATGLLGGWHHLAVTYDGRGGATAANGIGFYIDGVAVGSVTRSNSPAYVAMENLSAALELGRESPGYRQYDGGLDELRLWNVVRTVAEIQTTMSAELLGVEPGLVGYWRFNEGTGITVADDSPGTAAATLFNGAAWVAGGPMSGPDTTAPDLTNIVTSTITPISVTITFTTNEPTTGWISYTAGVACPCIDVTSAAIGTSHSVTLSGLTPDTVYQFVAKATDAAGNLGVGPTMTVRTLIAPPDATPPTVTITSPTSPTGGTVQIQATAVDNLGVLGVQFKLDGLFFGAEDTVAPYSIPWDTLSVLDGAHTITADARDAAGNIGSASVIVTVQNTPLPTTPHTVEFDGINDYASMPDAPSLSFGTGTADSPLTMEMWLRPDAISSRYQILGKWSWNNALNQEYRLFIASNSLRLELRDQSAGVTAYAYIGATGLLGGWHHLAVTYDGRGGATAADGIGFYIDGVPVGSVTRSNSPAYVAMENLTAAIELGRESPSYRQYDGGLDELRLWNVARTAAEIQALRSSELLGVEPGLVGYWRFNEGTGITVADDSPGTAAATLFNGVAWVAGGPMSGPDTTAPELTNIVTSTITPISVTITFTTDEPTTGWISYTAGVACPCIDVTSAAIGSSHSVTLSGLTPDTVYQFVAKATDAAGNLGVGPTMTVRTLVAPPDATPPTVTITSPTSPTGGTVQIQATAVDNLGVLGVQFKLDGVFFGAEDTVAPYSIPWDTLSVLDGAHTITADARDAAGNIGSASVIVTVQNTPLPTTPHTLDFDGINDYASIADAPSLSFGTGAADSPLTMEMWLRPDAISSRYQILGKWSWNNALNQEYRLFIASNSIRLELRDQSAGATAYAYIGATGLLGGWHHLAVTYDGRGGATAADGIGFYIDGVPVGSVTRSNSAAYVAMENLTAPIELGRESPSYRHYDGGLDELRLWNVARTAAQIQATRTTELLGVEPGLVGYWRFNEGTGITVADDSPGTAAATLFNGAAWVIGGPLP